MSSSLRLVSWTVLPGCLVVTAIAPLVFPRVAGAEFAGGVLPFQVMVWMLGVAFFTFHMRYALVAFERQREEFVSMVAGIVAGGAALLLLGEHLTSLTAALVFVGSEAVCLIVAAGLLTRHVESAGALRIAARPVLVTAVAAVVALVVLRDLPLAGAVAVLLLCAAGLFVFDRAAIGQARALLARLRGGGQG
jgi:O-antigen/teichoic acid export membrane protein